MPTALLQLEKVSQNCLQSTIQTSTPFNELLLSWNARRPKKGHFLISFSLNTNDFIPYAFWGSTEQYSFTNELALITVDSDTIMLKKGLAHGFSVKVEAQNGADLATFQTATASFSNSLEHAFKPLQLPQSYIHLDVPTLSQHNVNHPRKSHLCSPISLCALCSFLTQSALDPLLFATNVWDSKADIYGNWVFAIAEASHHLGNSWRAYVTRLSSFDEIITNLEQGIPTIISVQGPLTGSFAPYASGHLLVVTGFSAETNEIFCMDPAFDDKRKTATAYAANDLFEAWKRRGGFAYIFKKLL